VLCITVLHGFHRHLSLFATPYQPSPLWEYHDFVCRQNGSNLVWDIGSLELNSTTLLVQGSAMADGSIETEIRSHGKPLVGSSGTTNEGVVSVEVLRDFLKGSVAGLNVEEVDDGKFDGKPDAVEDIILPLDC
jgi:hypothetical protein